MIANKRSLLLTTLAIVFLIAYLTFVSQRIFSHNNRSLFDVSSPTPSSPPLIIIITPTKPVIFEYNLNATILVMFIIQRPERIADMLRLSQTLQHVHDIYWIVVEDGAERSELMIELLNRSRIPYTYLAKQTPKQFPGKLINNIYINTSHVLIILM
jgi:hypothetical protein